MFSHIPFRNWEHWYWRLNQDTKITEESRIRPLVSACLENAQSLNSFFFLLGSECLPQSSYNNTAENIQVYTSHFYELLAIYSILWETVVPPFFFSNSNIPPRGKCIFAHVNQMRIMELCKSNPCWDHHTEIIRVPLESSIS